MCQLRCNNGEAASQARTSPVSVLPRWRFISASISALSASPSTSPIQPRSLARLDQELPCSSLNTCRHTPYTQAAPDKISVMQSSSCSRRVHNLLGLVMPTCMQKCQFPEVSTRSIQFQMDTFNPDPMIYLFS